MEGKAGRIVWGLWEERHGEGGGEIKGEEKTERGGQNFLLDIITWFLGSYISNGCPWNLCVCMWECISGLLQWKVIYSSAHWFYTCKSVHLSERISINIYKHCNVAYKGGAPQNAASPDDITLMSLFKICTFYEKSELLLMKSMFIVNLTYSRE